MVHRDAGGETAHSMELYSVVSAFVYGHFCAVLDSFY